MANCSKARSKKNLKRPKHFELQVHASQNLVLALFLAGVAMSKRLLVYS